LKSDAHPRRVFAWFVPFRVANVNRGVPDPESHVTRRHPEWRSENFQHKTEDEEGNQYLEPGLPEVQEHLQAVIAELAAQYELDGIAIEGLRYPGINSDWGYSSRMLQQWREKSNQPTADPPAPTNADWCAMRRQAIDDSLDGMARAARKVRPGLQVVAFGLAEGPAPITLEDFNSTQVFKGAMQNWPKWMREKSVDSVILKNFRSNESGHDDFDAWDNFAAMMVKEAGVEAAVGISGSENTSINVIDQIKQAQRAGLGQIVLSNYREPIQDSGSRELFFRALAATVLSPDARRMPIESIPIHSQAKTTEIAEVSPPTETQPGQPPSVPDETSQLRPLPPGAPNSDRPQSQVQTQVVDVPPAPDSLFPPNLLSPSDEARKFLKRMFANIF